MVRLTLLAGLIAGGLSLSGSAIGSGHGPSAGARPPGPARAWTPDLRFNEVLADAPGPEGNGAGEWIELRNDGPTGIDLHGWALADGGDGHDALRPWTPGGPRVLEPGRLALLCDPEAALEQFDLPRSVIVLTVDDASLGNGLGAGHDTLFLIDPAGTIRDSVGWSSPTGEGVSLERVAEAAGDESPTGAPGWRPCRSPAGSTPGRINSWTPVPGDRSLSLSSVTPLPVRSGSPCTLLTRLRDEGGAGLEPVTIVLTTGPSAGGEGEHASELRSTGAVPPGGSATIVWPWMPPAGGSWPIRAACAGPVTGRGWWEADSLTVPVRFAPLARIVTEAQPRPLSGWEEWLECGVAEPDRDQPAPGWTGWSLRVCAVGSRTGSPRTFRFSTRSAQLLLVAAGEAVRMPAGITGPPPTTRAELWPGLRLSDAGCAIVLLDPLSTVIDSVVLRPAPDLPRGHSRQRWQTDQPGWFPTAWGFSRTPEDVSPGWRRGESSPGSGAGAHAPGSFRCTLEHAAGGEVVLGWHSSVERLWLEADLHDMSGARVATLLPRALVPGNDRHRWDPRRAHPPVPAGLYILLVRAEAEATGRHWLVRRALGVRP